MCWKYREQGRNNRYEYIGDCDCVFYTGLHLFVFLDEEKEKVRNRKLLKPKNVIKTIECCMCFCFNSMVLCRVSRLIA